MQKQKVLKNKIRSSFRDSAEQLRRTILLAWESSPKALLGILALTLMSAVLPLGIAYAGKRIIDAVVARSFEQTLNWVLVELALVSAQAVVQRGLFLMRSLLGARLGLDVYVRILDKALLLELRQCEYPDFYDRLTRARREASSRPVAMVNDSLQLLQNALTLLGYI